MAQQNDLGAYVDAQEAQSGINGVTEVSAQPIPFAGRDMTNNNPTVSEAKKQRAYETPEQRANRINTELNKIGWHKIDIKTLPTAGLFYQQDLELYIRAARGEEIKHWSTMNDEEIESVNDMWNYIIEKCVDVRSNSVGASWRDLKEVDRLYILLAIRELTFVDEENNLMVSVSEGKNIPITKEMVHYIEIPENIMRLYSPEERCFVAKLKTGRTIKLYIPSFGVTEWLANYVRQKVAEKVNFDQDFIQYAQMLIPDYRGLTQRKYEDMVIESHDYGVQEWSVIAYIMDTLRKTLTPTFKYTMEDGTEAEVPVTFRGGVKAIFSISDPLSALC